MGNPETVCLGLYGIELLDYNNLLEKVLPNVVVFAKSCEDTATICVLKKVDAIIGWDVFESWNPKDVAWIKIDKKKIKDILIKYEFSEERIDSQLEKLDKVISKKAQKTLF